MYHAYFRFHNIHTSYDWLPMEVLNLMEAKVKTRIINFLKTVNVSKSSVTYKKNQIKITKKRGCLDTLKIYDVPMQCNVYVVMTSSKPSWRGLIFRKIINCHKKTAYVVKWQIFSLQWAPPNSPLPLSNSRPSWITRKNVRKMFRDLVGV